MTDKNDDRLDAIEERLERGSDRMDAIERALKANTEATLEGNRDAREVLEIFQAVKGGIKVLGWIGVMVKWLAPLATLGVTAYSAFYAMTHGGQLPPKP
jgi:predicted nucleic acid-binding protein